MIEYQRVKLIISYDGTPFHGFQRQENAVTVQETLENALRSLFGYEICVGGCSRTDAGVHAEYFATHFDIPASFPAERLFCALNPFLPETIRAYESSCMPEQFNSRFCCRSKTYRYDFVTAHVPSPFYVNRAWQLNFRLDAGKMNKAAGGFTGIHDFKSFMASGSEVSSTVRTVNSASIVETNSGEIQKISFYINADGFLYNMVRIIAGTLVYISEGKLSPDVSEIITAKNRAAAGITAPPYGLYLYKVYYDDVQTKN
ncbi:MAG: tRNA pseudouridine(38-40) synthase TruA [Oscillospiraceae bacterium]|nr:tRNA pseudouridine(38-40) synthase TruA [Oscillospiraceae bacterium]